jgi:sortase A
VTTLIAEPSSAPQPEERPGAHARLSTRWPSRVAASPQRRRPIWWLVASWVAVILGSLALTLYFLEPLFQARTQSELLESYRATVTRSSNEAKGLPGVSTPTKAPELGAPVAIVEIGSLKLQDVVVEGGSASQTQAGPGHVSGTAAPGQPGNAVIVGRRFAYGGSFADLDTIETGQAILITTTQGQVVYTVDTVEQRTVEADELYGPTEDDRLTLVTSASAMPWNSESATVVVAKMEGQPFEPTPQGGRTDSSSGLSGESSAWAPLALAFLCFAAAFAAAVYLYRRASFRVAWLLTTPPLIVFTILLAETTSRLLPSWV